MCFMFIKTLIMFVTIHLFESLEKTIESDKKVTKIVFKSSLTYFLFVKNI